MIVLEFVKSIFIMCLILFGFAGLGLGMYKAVEYIEDRTFAAKRKIEQIIIIISILHIFLIIRGISIFLVIYSLIIQFLFYSLLETYPNIQPTNLYFIIGSILALGNHFLMLRAMILGKNYLIEMVVSFFIFVWCTPFCFFLSLSANDETIPLKERKTNTLIKSFVQRLIEKIK